MRLTPIRTTQGSKVTSTPERLNSQIPSPSLSSISSGRTINELYETDTSRDNSVIADVELRGMIIFYFFNIIIAISFQRLIMMHILMI